MKSPKSIEERLWEHTKTNENGCRLWVGNKICGYGQISYKNKMLYTHRLSAHIYLGLNLEDRRQLVLHKDDICRNRNCWNPEHLYIGDYSDNTRDRSKTEIPNFFGIHNEPKMHCPKGHEFTLENTYLQKETKICKICRLDNIHKFRERQRAFRKQLRDKNELAR